MNELQDIDEKKLLEILKKGVKEQRVFTDALLGGLNINAVDKFKFEFEFKTEQEYINFINQYINKNETEIREYIFKLLDYIESKNDNKLLYQLLEMGLKGYKVHKQLGLWFKISLIEKLEEIKKLGIIKGFKPIYYKNKLIDIDIEFFSDLPPKRALFELDCYLVKIGVIS